MRNKIYTLLLLVCAVFEQVSSQTALKVDLLAGSSVTIDGTAGFIKFRFSQKGEKFLKKNYILLVTQKEKRIFMDITGFNIPVKSFESSNKMALRDFFKMMDVANYPFMPIRLDYVELTAGSDYIQSGNAIVHLRIKDISNRYSFPLQLSKTTGNKYVLTTVKRININDFGLIPPDAMMGLVKTSEIIDVGLNLIFKITPVTSDK